MADIIGLMELLGALDSVDLDVHASRCVKVRNNKASCSRCVVACTSGAIKTVANELSIDPELCIGCGTCATMCPTAALEARNPTDKEIVDYAAAIIQESGLPLVFACSTFIRESACTFDKSRVIKVACLGRLDETILMTLVSAGINDIRLVYADCQCCPNRTGGSTVCEVNSTMRVFLSAWEHDSQVTLKRDMPPELQMSAELAQKTEDISGLSRRDFFAQFKTGAKSFVAGAAASITGVAAAATAEQTILPKVMADGTLPHFIPHRRETLLNCLSLLGDPVAGRINTRLWGQMTIDTAVCNSCRMCATFCPTGAITKFDNNDGTIGVEHYPAHCVQCRLCEDVCTVDALKISSDVELSYFVEGKTKQFTMKPLTRRVGKPDSIYSTMYNLLGGGQIYER